MLADQLRDENARLAEEKAELANEAAELADEKAELARENAKLREQLREKAPERADAKPRREPKTRRERKAERERLARAKAARLPPPTPVRDWSVRIAIGVAIAAASVSLTGYALYPLFHGTRSLFNGIFAAAVNQLWGLTAISPGVLGWFPDDGERKQLTPRGRAIAVVAGSGAVLLLCVLLALVGEVNADP